MIGDKGKKTIYNLLIKVSSIFNDFYIFKQGYFISADIEKPFLIQLDNGYISLFTELCGDFKILRVTDVKNFKKSLTEPKTEKEKEKDWPITENYFYSVISNSEVEKITEILKEKINEVNACTKWERFELSDVREENMKLLISLFKENNYINFLPKDNMDGPDIILTKSLLPLVSEKNYTELYYASKKKNSNLYLIVFDFQFSMFRLFMFHYYIPIKE